MSEVANSTRASASGQSKTMLAGGLQDAEAKSRIITTMQRWCIQNLGPRLKAVILTGSLARNEATCRQTELGLQFLSDAEFIVIVEDTGEIPSPNVVALICRGVEEELHNQGVFCKLSFGAVHQAFLTNLGETIFGYELLTCGEVVYGDPDILLKKAQYVPNVCEEDAWRILANRTVELLEIVPVLLEGPAQLSETSQYRLTKLYCDMATSILVFKKEFVSGYRARADKLCDLQRRGLLSGLAFDADWFVNMVLRCTEYKVTGCRDVDWPLNSPDSVQLAIDTVRSLWSWELAELDGGELSSADVMLHQHMQKQPLRERIRGWAYVIRRRGIFDSLRHSLRWLGLFRLASPRYCVYAAALNAVSTFEFPASSQGTSAGNSQGAGQLEARNSRLEPALSWLPIVNCTVLDKNGMAEAILWNYREFLVETRA